MAKKHIKENVLDLSMLYAKAQDLYEKAAEELSDSMVDPETYEDFIKIKKDLDNELNGYSSLFSLALHSRNDFVKSFNREKQAHSRLCKLVDSLYINAEKNPKEYRDAVMNQFYSSCDKLRIYEEVEAVSSVKNRLPKYTKALVFPRIRQYLETLDTFIQEAL